MTPLYCNPLALPNYGRGRPCFDKEKYEWGWYHETRRDFREMADPTVIWWENEWFLFPSAGMVWRSKDWTNWEFCPIEPFDIGYAPTVEKWRDLAGETWILLTASGSEMWRARHPLGPWENIGPIRLPSGEVGKWDDPALFFDDDERLFCYNGIGARGIWVVELDRENPAQIVSEPLECLKFNPENKWERGGDCNEDAQKSMTEGAWMTKHNGRYFLQYSAPGTEWKTYAVGTYVGDSPLGPFKYQARNPILRAQNGDFVNGTGHHCLVRGPNGPDGTPTLWCFYSTSVRIQHAFERRIGLDAAGFDEAGNLFVNGPSQTPQRAPGTQNRPENGNDSGLLPLSINRFCRASSFQTGREPIWAFDNNIRTWWQAAPGDKSPWICVDLNRPREVGAARICFGDVGLDYDAGIVPAPYKWALEGSLDGQTWFDLWDARQNAEEKHIAFGFWRGQTARWVRLQILEWPRGMSASLWQLTLFGR